MVKCATEGCDNPKQPQRRICSKCNSRLIRARDPVADAYRNLHGSARRRGYPFTITVEEWVPWIVKTDYIVRKGRAKSALSIDRIRNNEGYTIDNIQVVEKGPNTAKYWTFYRARKLAEEHQIYLNVEMTEYPF